MLSINKDWLVCSGNIVEAKNWHEEGIPIDNATIIDLPCPAHMALEDQRGVTWYQKKFYFDRYIDNHERVILKFESADFRCEPSLNGQMLGIHLGCEDPFSFDITDKIVTGENRLTVRVSKPYEESVDGYTFGEVPHRNQMSDGLISGWCYNESGLTGKVSVDILPDCRVVELFPETQAETGEMFVHITAYSDRAENTEAQIRLSTYMSPNGSEECAATADVVLCKGENKFTLSLKVNDVHLWSIDDPNLYIIEVVLSTKDSRHVFRERTGYRTFCVGEDGYFRLNGKRILLRASHTGNCMPLSVHNVSHDIELLRKDFLMAKAVGFNCVRFISGAALPIQLDLCDEIGLMVYEEPVASWRTENGPHAEENYLHDLLSMVKRDRCHPSITIWGLLNETPPTEPFDQICEVARFSLPALREIDPTRLVLYSSGRWDVVFAKDDERMKRVNEVGSLSNPYTCEWQKLWNGEGCGAPIDPEAIEVFDKSLQNGIGDVHFYPSHVPMPPRVIARYRAWGHGWRRPVFISESGIGSVLDTDMLIKEWERQGINGFYPDVKSVQMMNDSLKAMIRCYRLDKVLPFISTLMKGSMKNHVYYRRQCFDILRANPYCCGISLTGLLDHSICGEGLWTLFRQYKPGIADVLQNGFAPLKWCLFSPKTDLFVGEKLHVEAVLANEDQLTIGRSYTVRAGILNGNGVYDLRNYCVEISETNIRGLSVPIFEAEWETDKLPSGEYTFHVEFQDGAYATDGDMSFCLSEHCHTREEKSVYGVGLSDGEIAAFMKIGIIVKPIRDYDGEGVILCGHISKQEIMYLSQQLNNGATVIALRAAERDDFSTELLSEERRPVIENTENWLYHNEYVLIPSAPVFDHMETGVVSAARGTGFVSDLMFRASSGSEPDDTWAIAFCTGYPNKECFLGGFLIGKYCIGEGVLILNACQLLAGIDSVPYCEKLLVNLVDWASR